MSEAITYKLPPFPWGDDFPGWLEVRSDEEIKAEFAAYAIAAIEAQGVPDDADVWCEYVAEMVGAYISEPVGSAKVKAIAGIIRRRMPQRFFASAPPAPQASEVQQEPVAWMWKNTKTDAEGVYLEDPATIGIELNHPAYQWTLLYTNPAQQALTPCNCRWDGETQVQQCTLHKAHVEAIHEWAERAKTAEKTLSAQQAKPQPLSDEQIRRIELTVHGYTRQPLDVKAFARAIESAACADREARIAELLANEKVLLAQIQGHTQWREKIIKASEQAYGESAVRYKFSLTKNGKCMNTFPKEIDGRWFALVPAEDDGHIGHVARIAELERQLVEARNQALEDAAGCCDEESLQAVAAWKLSYHPEDQGREIGADNCAAAIRSMKKDQP